MVIHEESPVPQTTRTTQDRNHCIQMALSQAKAKQKVVASIVSLVDNAPQNIQFKHHVYRQIVAAYGMDVGLKYYHAIKQFLKPQ